MIRLNVNKTYAKYDVMRGIAALVVLGSHVMEIYIRRIFPNDDVFFGLSSTLARHAVLVFFLLSGYLITNSIIANIKRNDNFDAASYLIARVTRIYPPLIGSIIVVLVCWAIINTFDLPGKFQYGIPTDTFLAREKFAFNYRDIYLTLTMQNGLLQANGPLWSLYIECIIYLAAMFATLCLFAKSKLHYFTWVMFTILAFYFGNRINSHFNFFLLIWVFGALVSVVNSIGMRQKIASNSLFLLLTTFGIVLISGITDFNTILIRDKSILAESIIQFIFCILYCYVIFISPLFDNVKSKLLISTGDFSYSLYIIHFPLLLLIYSLTQNWMQSSGYRAGTVAFLAALFVIFSAILFAKYFENQRIFKPIVARFFALIDIHVIKKTKKLLKGCKC